MLLREYGAEASYDTLRRSVQPEFRRSDLPANHGVSRRDHPCLLATRNQSSAPSSAGLLFHEDCVIM